MGSNVILLLVLGYINYLCTCKSYSPMHNGWTWLHGNHYAQSCKIYRCIGNFMSMSPVRFMAHTWLRVMVGGGPN